ncbi:MAG: hypothetical protein Q9217_006460 [Psora testacea]
MTQASVRPPTNLQPRPKAIPTFSSTFVDGVSTSAAPQLSRSSSQSRQSSPGRHTASTDVSDRAPITLIRRILCPPTHSTADKDRPIDEFLPPLTSSNEVDLQLYAIIAIVVKDLVYSWYGKITPDQSFVEEVVRIIAHCTRALESRLRSVDLESLILDEVPELLERHVHAYRVSYESFQREGSLSTDPRVIYHNLNPHPALEPIPDDSTVEEQSKNEAVYRQLLVQGALAILLPTEDLENACLRTLVADVIAEPILGNSIGGKVCESWFVWGSITKLVDAVKAKTEANATGEEMEVDTRGRLEKFGLVTTEKEETEKDEKTGGNRKKRRSTFSSMCWRVLQYGYLTILTVKSVMVGILAAQYQAPRSTRSVHSSPIKGTFQPSFQPRPRPRPILKFKIFSLISRLIDLRHRMPWLYGMLALWQHHLVEGRLEKVGGTDGILDQ